MAFVGSLMERVVEEKSAGNPQRARDIRAQGIDLVGPNLRDIDPGSDRARQVKNRLIGAGLWSQYLEVAIGPDAEIFTKTPILPSVGFGEPVGVRRDSTWNNLEPEVNRTDFDGDSGLPRVPWSRDIGNQATVSV